MSEVVSIPKGGMRRVKKPRKLAMPEERCRKTAIKAVNTPVKKTELDMDDNATEIGEGMEPVERQRCDTDELIEFCFPGRKGKKVSDVDSGLQPSPKRQRRSRPRNSIELYIQAANMNNPNGNAGGDYATDANN